MVKVYQILKDIVLYYRIDVDSLIKQLNEAKLLATQYGVEEKDIYIEFDHDDGIELSVVCYREETDEEKKQRLKKAKEQRKHLADRAKDREKADYEMYLALKKRFEDKK